jgi:hypothetical protein
VAVGRPKAELTHAPRFVSRGLEYLCSSIDGSRVEPVNVVDPQIGDVAVIAELARRRNVRAAPEHERDLARATESPIARVDVIELAPEYVAVPLTGAVEVMHGQNRVRARDLHRCILAPPGGKRVFAAAARATGAAVPDRGGGRASCRVKLLSDALNDVPRMRTRAAGVLARLRLDMQRGAGRPREAGEARHDSLGELIRGYQRDTDAFDEAVAERLGVNRTDLRCLDVLVEGAGQGRQLTPKELAEASQLSPSAITTVLDRLDLREQAVAVRT